MMSTHIGDGLLTFAFIDRRWYISMTDYFTAFFSAVNLAPKVDICTDVCLFHEHAVGVEPTTERSPAVYLPVILSYL